MKGLHAPSVVRLSAAPKRVVHQVVLTKRVTHVERNVDTARVPMKEIAEPRQVISKKGSWTTPLLAKRSHQAHQAVTASLGMTLATGMLGKLATVLLVPMLFFQPLLPLFAADESVAPAEPAPVSAPEAVPAPVDTPPPAPEPQAEVPPAEVAPTEPAPEVVSEEQNSEETATEELPQEEVSPSSPETSEEAAAVDETEEVPEESVGGAETIVPDETVEEQATTPEEGSTPEGEVAGEATTTPEVITPEPPIGGSGGGASVSETSVGAATEPNSIADGDATTTDETVASAEVVENGEAVAAGEEEITSATEDDMTQAARNAEAAREAEEAKRQAARLAMRKEIEAEITKGCLTIDNVGYYCLKNFEGMAATPATSTKITSIQSLPDTAGDDKEIFITRNGESIQLTHNAWDDTFPAMDVTGASLVWQGTVDGRWQIFFADLSGTSSPVIVQLTHSTESNFNPRVDGNTVVWQGWVNGNWEIFLADHLSPSSYYPDGEEDILPSENRRLGIDGKWHVSRLSENETHDMFPAISGGLVTWQSFQEGSWNVYAYNMKTGESTQLSQGGVKSENPRFAVTWDERDANGNMRMVGYDIASGKTIDLTDVARHTPNNQQPYQPELPSSLPNQAALPPTAGSGTTTPTRADGDDEGGLANGLDV